MEAATAQPTAAPSRRVYIDFEPAHDLIQEEENDTYVIYLAGFKKEQLRVQVAKSGKLISTTGERFLAENRWSRFRKEFQVPKNCKVDEIRARFDNGLLYIMLPKAVPEQGKGEPAKTTSLHKEDDSIGKKEGTSSMKRERSSTRMAREEKEKEKEKEEKEKEQEKEKEKEKEAENLANKNKDREDHKEKEGTLSDAESLTERIKQKMGEMDFAMYLQPKHLMVGLALVAVLSVGWYFHHRMTSTPESGELHPNI